MNKIVPSIHYDYIQIHQCCIKWECIFVAWLQASVWLLNQIASHKSSNCCLNIPVCQRSEDWMNLCLGVDALWIWGLQEQQFVMSSINSVNLIILPVDGIILGIQPLWFFPGNNTASFSCDFFPWLSKISFCEVNH